jgi:hypothetical protein
MPAGDPLRGIFERVAPERQQMQASMVRPQITENPELRAVQENQELEDA